MKHEFNCKLEFNGGYQGYGTIDNRNLKSKISIPKEMNGPDIGTNPDEMLLSAAGTCFIISLSVLFERSNLPLEDLKVDAVATIDVTDGILTYEAIDYDVYVKTSMDESREKLVKRMVHKAEEGCMITRALKGNVDVRIKNINVDFM